MRRVSEADAERSGHQSRHARAQPRAILARGSDRIGARAGVSAPRALHRRRRVDTSSRSCRARGCTPPILASASCIAISRAVSPPRRIRLSRWRAASSWDSSTTTTCCARMRCTRWRRTCAIIPTPTSSTPTRTSCCPTGAWLRRPSSPTSHRIACSQRTTSTTSQWCAGRLASAVGGFRDGFDGSQDHDLMLRVTEAARHVGHVPDVLYAWRMVPGSTAVSAGFKPLAQDAGRRAVADALQRRGVEGTYRPRSESRPLHSALRDLIGTPSVDVIVVARTEGDDATDCVAEHRAALNVCKSTSCVGHRRSTTRRLRSTSAVANDERRPHRAARRVDARDHARLARDHARAESARGDRRGRNPLAISGRDGCARGNGVRHGSGSRAASISICTSSRR